MAKVILLCGKVGAGKTTYAHQLMGNHPAIHLSTDDLMLQLFPKPLGDRYDEDVAKAQQYLYKRAADIIAVGVDVILEGTGWRRADRLATSSFFRERGIPFEWHYIDITDEAWRAHIDARNLAVQEGRSTAYFVDERLLEKCLELFEAPLQDEIDVYVLNEY